MTLTNRDKLREYQKKWREENREKVLRRWKEYYKKNREDCLRRNEKYRGNNRDKINQKRRGSVKKYGATINGHLRRTFNSMKRRCNNPNIHNYSRYGGRGIRNKFKSADEFVDYVINELRVDPRGLQIDRIDNNGHYEKGNIRFVTAEVNTNNRECTIKRV